MQTTQFGHHRLSRMMLGTVQFGMPYGIANRTGQPNHAQVLEILSVAAEGGVNCIDTAAAYGSSEDVLGRALQELHLSERMTVVTKVRHLTNEDHATPAAGARAVRTSVEQSLRRLRLDRLACVLFHSVVDFAYMDVLQEFQRRGLIEHVGVSCDHLPRGALKIVEAGEVQAVQLPASMLDHRHRDAGVFKAAARRGAAVFIRSVYLQGLLLMPEESVPQALQEVIPLRKTLAEVACQAGISMTEMAVRYMLSQEGVSCVLTGVENVSQLRENIALFSRGPLESNILAAIERATAAVSEIIITPNIWPKG